MAAYLKSLNGVGQLVVDGKNLGTVRYQIRISRRRTLKEGRGWINGDPDPLLQFYNAGSGQLNLEGGGSVTILAKEWWAIGRVDIVITGPIPGV
jgi:hypothetical protein